MRTAGSEGRQRAGNSPLIEEEVSKKGNKFTFLWSLGEEIF